MDKIDLIFASSYKFTCDAIKRITQASGISCYTLIDDTQMSYIFSDLSPKIFLCSQDFFKKYEVQTLEALASFSTKAILCSDDIRDIDVFDEYWDTKIDTFRLEENLLKELKRMS